MKIKFKKAAAVFLSIIMLLSLSVSAFADADNLEKDETLIEIQNDRYYYVNEPGPTQTKRTDISASQARDQDLAMYAAAAILAFSGPVGPPSSALLLVGNAIYDMGVAGYAITETTIVKRYMVNRLTGERHLDSTTTEAAVRVYASESNGGYSLHRSWSWSLRHK